MKRTLILSAAILLGWLGVVSVSQAQVFVRAPFVRVWVGDGVGVRAPFVNIYVPPGPRTVYMPPPVIFEAPPPTPVQPVQPKIEPVPAPQPLPGQAQSLEVFAKTFQPKAGTYEVTLVNPANQQPTAVRFTLPEGTPRRVITTPDSVEFFYRIGHWVRIEFDRGGAIVTAR